MAITFSDLVDYEVVKSAPYVVRRYDEETGFYTTLFDNDEQSIAEAGGLGLQLLGLGHNGHIGFNEPAPEFPKETHCVELTESTINANARFFEKKEDVPTMAITMGMGDILAAKKVVLAATGLAKVPAIRGLIMDDVITTQNPSTMLKMHEDAVVVIDRELADAVGYRA